MLIVVIKKCTDRYLQVFTVEEMMPHVAHLSGAHTKNLFLKDKKKKLWLLSARHDANVNLSSLAKKVGAPGGLRFADETILQEKLGVRQGCVTPLALINDRANDVTFILDESLVDGTFERMHFHPMDNAATIGLTPTEFLKFLNAINHNPVSVKLE